METLLAGISAERLATSRLTAGLLSVSGLADGSYFGILCEEQTNTFASKWLVVYDQSANQTFQLFYREVS